MLLRQDGPKLPQSSVSRHRSNGSERITSISLGPGRRRRWQPSYLVTSRFPAVSGCKVGPARKRTGHTPSPSMTLLARRKYL